MEIKSKYSILMRVSLIASISVGSGVFSYYFTDWVARKAISNYQFKIENAISKRFGHKLVIGQYEGLRPWGIALGETKFLPTQKDLSNAKASNIIVQLEPLSTIFNRRPKIKIKLFNSRLTLKKNENGSLWTFGEAKIKRNRNLELNIIIDKSASLITSYQTSPIKIKGNVNLNLLNKQVKTDLKANYSDKELLSLKGYGYWNKLTFDSILNFKNIDIDKLSYFYPKKKNIISKGKINGMISLNVNDKRIKCDGSVSLTSLKITKIPLDDSLISNKALFNCKDNILSLKNTELKYGLWKILIKGNIPFDKNNLSVFLNSSVSQENDNDSKVDFWAELPFKIKSNKVNFGKLNAKVESPGFSLNLLRSFLNQSISGELSGKGYVYGPLASLQSNFELSIKNPQFSNIRIQENWEGNFASQNGIGGKLSMKSTGAAIPSSLVTSFDNEWNIDSIKINRLGGIIEVLKDDKYKWNAKDFRLDRLEIALPPEKSFKRIFGTLSGSGIVDINPFIFRGDINLKYPRLTGFKLKDVNLYGEYEKNKYLVNGKFIPLDNGEINIKVERILGKLFKSSIELKKISPSWLINNSLQIPKINIETPIPSGRAKELGQLTIKPQKNSLDLQLKEWLESVISVSNRQNSKRQKEIINPDDVKGYVNAKINIYGSDISNLDIDLDASGKLWTNKNNLSSINNVKPFSVIIKGPLRIGEGIFNITNIPFSLLSIIFPTPSGLSGVFGINGKYFLSKRRSYIQSELVSKNLGIGREKLILNKGLLNFSDSNIDLDIDLKSSTSIDSLLIKGKLPTTLTRPINLRVESHGDGIKFLDQFTGDTLKWNSGRADLRLLVSGTIKEPKANGFLVLNNGELVFRGKNINSLNSTIVFDFNRVEVKTLKAQLEDYGNINGKGDIALFKYKELEAEPLKINIDKYNLNTSSLDLVISSDLIFYGSIFKPIIAGSVEVKEGTIFTQRASNKNDKKLNIQKERNEYKKISDVLPEQSWDRINPLILFIKDENAPASKIVNSIIPDGFSTIKLDNLRVNLGPNLKIISQPVANFEVEGFLLLNGSVDRSINANGLVKLQNGRVNLFTTTFYLDKRSQNVAVFVPSMGLIPYVDVKMISRVPDTVRDPTEINSSSDFVTNGSGAFGIGGSRFVKVEIIATGPADRLKNNYQLRSTPPVPENELIGLIGGNSLTNLFQGRDNNVFADVLNRSFVTPVLGNISGAFNERLQIALYPAYINTATSDTELIESQPGNSSEDSSSQLSSQQAWVTEMGIDLTDRISFSLQATPNREDIPPQGNLTIQLNQNFGLFGSFDKNGNWQSQLEIFLRY